MLDVAPRSLPTRHRRRALALAGTLALASAAGASAANRVVNGAFDSSLAAWQVYGAIGTWSGSEGHARLGAARFQVTPTLPAGNATAFGQCVPVTPGKTYDFGGWFRFAPGFHSGHRAQVFVFWKNGTDCATAASVGAVGTPLRQAATVWQQVRTSATAPAAARAASLLLIISFSAPAQIHVYWDDLYLGNCMTSAFELCLSDSRFRVHATWRTADGDHGDAEGVQLTDDGGYFFFFDPANPELFVKIIDACAPPFDSYWVFAAGLTNVRVDLTVADTETGAVEPYVNPLNRAFVAIQDTGTFRVCP